MEIQKTLVYLDQNYISNIAKALHLEGWKDPGAPYYRDLSELLWALTVDGKLLSPAAPFHEQEAGHGARVRNIVWHVSRQLSCQTSFLSWTALHFGEIEAAAKAYADGGNAEELSVSQVFNSDPDRSLSEKELSPGLMVKLHYSNEFHSWESSVNATAAAQYAAYKHERVSRRLSFEDEVEAQKLNLIEEVFMPPELVLLMLPKEDRELLSIGSTGVSARQQHIRELATSTGKEWDGFLRSTMLSGVNTIEIVAQLRASDVVFHASEEHGTSFQTDLDIIATVLPYVDIVATDAGIKERYRKTTLPDKYGAEIFSNVKGDRNALIDRLISR